MMDMQRLRDFFKDAPENDKIEHILNQIGENKYLVGLGGEKGYNQLNTKFLIEKGYDYILIDNQNEIDSEEVKKHKLFGGNVTPLLRTYKCPRIFDFLSFGLRGIDYWVLRNVLRKYHPLLIVAEFNPYIPSGVAMTIENDLNFQWAGDNYYGFSFEAGKMLAEEFGYKVIHQENNKMFLVSNSKNEEFVEIEYEQVSLFKDSERNGWVQL